METLFDMVEDWKNSKFEIALRIGGKDAVSGEIWGKWGIHLDTEDGFYRLTYVPNGKMIPINGLDKAQLKELARRLNIYLIDGAVPKDTKEMKDLCRSYAKKLKGYYFDE